MRTTNIMIVFLIAGVILSMAIPFIPKANTLTINNQGNYISLGNLTVTNILTANHVATQTLYTENQTILSEEVIVNGSLLSDYIQRYTSTGAVSGTANIHPGSSKVFVEHKLGYTPTPGNIMATPLTSLSNCTSYSIGNFTTSTFYIVMYGAGGAEATPAATVSFAWTAIFPHFDAGESDSPTPPPPPAPANYTYIVSVSGPNYIAEDSDSITVASSTDFGAMLNSLNSLLVSGDSILITNGTYLVSTLPTISKTHITIMGEGASVIKAYSTTVPSYSLFRIYNGGSYVTVDNIIFDANQNTNISPVVLVGGVYNTIQNCQLLHAIQYGIQSWKADHFIFQYNTVMQAQYGLCTGGDINQLSTNGLIINNTIYNCRDCGVKLKWAQDVIVANNTIDTAYVTWTTNSSGNPTEGTTAIRFYTDDGPLYDVIAADNTIIDSVENRHTYGVMQDADHRYANPAAAASFGLEANTNDISDVYTGLLIKKVAEITYAGNVFTDTRHLDIDIWG